VSLCLYSFAPNLQLLSSVNEVSPIGAVQSFIIHPDGSLSMPQDTVSSTGDRPAFVAALSTGQVGVMNFDGGSGLFIPTTDSPLHFERNAPAIAFPTKPNTISHPHMLLQHGDEVFVPDLVGPTRLAPYSPTLILTQRYRVKIPSGDLYNMDQIPARSSYKVLSHNQLEVDLAT